MVTAHHSRRSIVAGSSALRRLMKSESATLSRAPILLVSSGESTESQPYPKVHTACEGARFVTSMELALRTVPATVTSAYPTLEDVTKANELIKRTGATSVLGVGSGAAIDLAKAVFADDDTANKLKKLILVPSTWGGSLAAGSSRSMLLDPSEETLVLDKHHGHDDDENTVHIALDPKSVCDSGPPNEMKDAIFAALTIGIDSIYSSDGLIKHPNQVISTLKCGLDALEEEDATKAHHHTVDALYHAGELISYGTRSTNRNISMACISSILPISFPKAHVLTFVASLLPGLCETFEGTDISQMDEADRMSEMISRVKSHAKHGELPSLSNMAVDSKTLFDVPSMLKQIQSNQAVWNCLDVDDDVFEEVLHRSLGR